MPAPHLLAALLATPTSWLPVLRAVQTDSAVVAAAEPRARAWTLLHFAAWDGKPAYAALLLERGANPAARDAHGSTPLHVAAARDAPAVLLRALTLRPALVEARDDGHRTPLHSAAAAGATAAAVWLLQNGAAADARDAAGETPLLYLVVAEPLGWRTLAKELVDAGADPATAHAKAVAAGHWNAVRCLLTIMLEEEEKP